MSRQNSYVYIDGKKIECILSTIDITYEYSSPWTSLRPSDTHIEITGIVKNITYLENNDMELKYFDTNATNDNNLATKYKKLDIDEGKRKLIDKGVLNIDGTLTRKGEILFLNVLLDKDGEKKLVDAIESIEDSEKPKKV